MVITWMGQTCIIYIKMNKGELNVSKSNKIYLIVEVEKDPNFNDLDFQQWIWKEEYEKVNLTLPGKHQARIIDVSKQLPAVQFDRSGI